MSTIANNLRRHLTTSSLTTLSRPSISFPFQSTTRFITSSPTTLDQQHHDHPKDPKEKEPQTEANKTDPEDDTSSSDDDNINDYGEFVNRKTGEVGGPRGPEPTRYGDWEKGGRCSDF